jgi:glycosyltransferase involved in cell wall biosynthesis
MLWRNIIKADSRIEVIVGTFSPFPYEDGDVYVYPSRLDGIGLTLPEAIASGLPAITTDNAPMNEFVIDDVNGKLVRVDRFLGRHDGYYWAESLCSIQSLASAMQFYIDNPEVLSKHRIGAKEFAKRNFDWMAHAPELCRIVSEATQMGPISSVVRLEIEKEFRNPFMQYLVDTKRFLEKLKF